MDPRFLLVAFVSLVVAAVFLLVWSRRDRGAEPEDRLPDALHEPLNGRQNG